MTLEPDTLTLVFPLKDGSADATRDFIRSQTDQGWVASVDRWKVSRDDDPLEGPDTGTRLGDLDFGAFPGLHCCAFVVLDAETKPHFFCDRDIDLPPYLIIEATIDGSGEAFIRDLVDHATAHLMLVLEHCVGLPANAHVQPDLLVDFLMRRRVRHSTYFSGVPGKAVSEIRSEARLRRFLTDALQKTYFPPGSEGMFLPRPKARFSEIQRQLRNLVRAAPLLNLTEERHSDPFSVRHGRKIVFGGLMAVLGSIAFLCGMLLGYFGVGWSSILGMVQAVLGVDALRLALCAGCLGFAWYLLRELRIWVTPETRAREYRGGYYLIDGWIRIVQRVLQVLVLALGIAIGLQFIALVQVDGSDAPDLLPWWQHAVISSGLVVIFLVALFRIKTTRAVPLRKAENGPHVTPTGFRERSRLLALVDASNLAHTLYRVLIAAAALAILNPAIGYVWSSWVADVTTALGWLIAVSFYLGIAIVLLNGIKDLALIVAHWLQRCEDVTFASAKKLAEHNIERNHIWAREEQRTHLNQNHFASATLVKSWPRMVFLRMSLLLVNLVARYWDNRGKLGGIPTIFSARWLLLDDGHRLVFLTNYVGAWDSYLGEFSDLNAYIGVNAIWTNTYLHLDPAQQKRLGTDGRHVGFPTSRFLLFGGACLEQPFKAYVRQSQVETLAWYGAYPRLSVPNIHDNARVRADLFKDLSVDALDAFFRRL